MDMTNKQMEEIASRFDQAQAGSLYALEDGNSFKAGYEAGRIAGMAEAIQVLTDGLGQRFNGEAA